MSTSGVSATDSTSDHLSTNAMDVSNKKGRRTYPEYLLISSFLCRAKLANIRAALNWIHNNQ